MEERKAFILSCFLSVRTPVLNESVASVCYALPRVVVLLSPKYMYIDLVDY